MSIETEPRVGRRNVPGAYRRQPLPVLSRIPLIPPKSLDRSLQDALSQRRSAEIFGPLTTEHLSDWLYHVAHIQALHETDQNRQQRAVPSFGALHPSHVLLQLTDGTWFTYLAGEHSLGGLEVDPVASRALTRRVETMFPRSDAVLIALLADLSLGENYYDNPTELMLRDAGVLFGHASLVAAGLGLAFRILGDCGSPHVEQLLSVPFKPMGVGLALIGARVA